MYICPTCNQEFASEDLVVKHYLKCWQEKNPCHKPKPAPRSESITIRKVNPKILNLFNQRSNYEGSNA